MLNDVLTKVRNKGFPLPRKPDVEGEEIFKKLPHLTELSSADVGKLYILTTAWLNYSDWLLANAKAQLIFVEAAYNQLATEIFLSLPDDFKTQKEKLAVRDADPRLKEKLEELLTAKASVELLSSLRQSYEKTSYTISREITRRQLPESQEWTAGRQVT